MYVNDKKLYIMSTNLILNVLINNVFYDVNYNLWFYNVKLFLKIFTNNKHIVV